MKRPKIDSVLSVVRKHYPGLHGVEVLLNGSVHPGGQFYVV